VLKSKETEIEAPRAPLPLPQQRRRPPPVSEPTGTAAGSGRADGARPGSSKMNSWLEVTLFEGKVGQSEVVARGFVGPVDSQGKQPSPFLLPASLSCVRTGKSAGSPSTFGSQ
jgi:hypothetical protein